MAKDTDDTVGSSFKVQDKRRFDADGLEINADGPGKEKQGDDFIMKEPPHQSASSATAEPDINFATVIMSLATQVMMQLGEMPPIEGQPAIPKNLTYAKQTIDVLSLLREKTKGNLDEFEDKIFEDILHTLRMSYIKARA
jgi:hypothetical protein